MALLRLFAWWALAAFVAFRIWLLVDAIMFFHVFESMPSLWPLWAWGFLIWLMAPLPLVGMWLLFSIRSRGSGAYRWKWWVGVPLSAMFIYDILSIFDYATTDEAVYLFAYHPWPEFITTVMAMAAIWMLTWWRPVRVSQAALKI